MKALKAFIEPSEAQLRSVKIKFKLIFILIQLFEMHGAERVSPFDATGFFLHSDVFRGYRMGPVASNWLNSF